MNFGKYMVVDGLTHNFEKEPDWYWKIKPPTSGDELAMSKFLAYSRSILKADGTREEYPATWPEICHREIALLFAGTNIPRGEKSVLEGGEALLKERASIEEIEAALHKMPHSMVLEIWQAIGDAVPGWGAQRPKVRDSENSEILSEEATSLPTPDTSE